jgi:hypothetical protein
MIIGTVVPSTRPVVIVTFLIHKSSRCSVVGGTMHPDIGDDPARADHAGRDVKGFRDADGLDRDVGTETVLGEGGDLRLDVPAARADGVVGAEAAGVFEPRVGEVDGDDGGGAGQPGGLDRGQPNRAGAGGADLGDEAREADQP